MGRRERLCPLSLLLNPYGNVAAITGGKAATRVRGAPHPC